MIVFSFSHLKETYSVNCSTDQNLHEDIKSRLTIMIYQKFNNHKKLALTRIPLNIINK
jgi:hypothetical protein